MPNGDTQTQDITGLFSDPQFKGLSQEGKRSVLRGHPDFAKLSDGGLDDFISHGMTAGGQQTQSAPQPQGYLEQAQHHFEREAQQRQTEDLSAVARGEKSPFLQPRTVPPPPEADYGSTGFESYMGPSISPSTWAGIRQFAPNVMASGIKAFRSIANLPNVALGVGAAVAPEAVLPYIAYKGTEAALTPQQKGEDLPSAIERRLFGASAVAGAAAGAGAAPKTLTERVGQWNQLASPTRVREAVYNEGQARLTAIKALQRQDAASQFPSSNATVPAETIAQISSDAVEQNIRGTMEVPKPLKSMQGKATLEEPPAAGGAAIRQPSAWDKVPESVRALNPDVDAVFKSMGNAAEDVPLSQVLGWRTELGRLSKSRSLPNDVRAAVTQGFDRLTKLADSVYTSEGKGAQWRQARKGWENYSGYWDDSASPLKRAIDADNSTDFFASLAGPDKVKARGWLTNLSQYGGTPDLVDASSRMIVGQKLGQMTTPIGGVRWRLEKAAFGGVVRAGATRPVGSVGRVTGEGIVPFEELGRRTPFQQRIEQQLTRKLATGEIDKAKVMDAAKVGDIDANAPSRIFRAVARGKRLPQPPPRTADEFMEQP